jgi:hypothetical protein
MSEELPPGPLSTDRRALPDPAEIMARVFPRRQCVLVVTVDLDPVPGWGNVAEDYRALTQKLLTDSIGHYNPVVTIVEGMS